MNREFKKGDKVEIVSCVAGNIDVWYANRIGETDEIKEVNIFPSDRPDVKEWYRLTNCKLNYNYAECDLKLEKKK